MLTVNSKIVTAVVGLVSLLSCTFALAAPTASSAYGVHIQTGLASYPPFGQPGEVVLARTHALGAHFQKLSVSWKAVAPSTPPPGFEAANPDNGSYLWTDLDITIANTIAHGLTPVIDILEPPSWARSVSGAPELPAFASFVQAIATRYDGRQAGLPRVSYWEAWNEPNVSLFLEPQLQNGAIVSAAFYRAMLEAFAGAVHTVNPDNVVIGGALFPNGVHRPGLTAIAPLEFTRQVFCLSKAPRPRLTCKAKVPVDAWSVHPYTSGGPSTLPANRENIWIADLGELAATVRAAQRLGSLASTHPAQLWVSEFSWDSSPPDPQGVPAALQQRWVAESLYRAWGAGVSAFFWFKLSDEPLGASLFQSGLYYFCSGGLECQTAKPAAAAFRFPFVAFSGPWSRVRVWGRAPAEAKMSVSVQWLQGLHWRTFATLHSDEDGIFAAKLKLPRGANRHGATLRARLAGGAVSPSFSLRRPAEILATPFGS